MRIGIFFRVFVYQELDYHIYQYRDGIEELNLEAKFPHTLFMCLYFFTAILWTILEYTAKQTEKYKVSES